MAVQGRTRSVSKTLAMAIDLNDAILRRSVRATGGAHLHSCSGCLRTPVPGERVSVFEGGVALCTLCVAALPAGSSEPLRTEMVHVAERRLVVVPHAA